MRESQVWCFWNLCIGFYMAVSHTAPLKLAFCFASVRFPFCLTTSEKRRLCGNRSFFFFKCLSVCSSACRCVLTHSSPGAVCVRAVAPLVQAVAGSSQWGPAPDEPSSAGGPHTQSSLRGEGGAVQISGEKGTDGREARRWEREKQQDFRTYVMWVCTTVLPQANSPNLNRQRHQKNSKHSCPREIYDYPWDLTHKHSRTTFSKGQFGKIRLLK